MPFLEINDLKKVYKDFTLSASLSVEQGEMLCIIGPSGSGKSTLLSLIAGLESPDGGTIVLDGTDITSKRIQERGIGMVFQDFTLFPSMNVQKNIEFGMKAPKGERKKTTEALLSLVGLEGYGKRSVTSLSGGEAQRVQLARALAAEPRVLLLDEPLSALDAPLRKSIRSAIRAIHDTLGITMLYVTHDREEAFAISDSILIMNGGKCIAKGSAEELYRHPKDLFTAFFTGEGTAIPATLVYEGMDGMLFFRPEDAILSEEPVDPEMYPVHIVLGGAEILSAEFTGSGYMLGVDYQGYPLLVHSATKPRRRTVSVMILRESALNIS